ncbi:MAG TPA: NCS2 family permease [Planctomycetaceae bacterium]|jgi:AGZA family xanthine/uracil permease-like MFS transporter|nr:NCS2 family permease [Planctomycetaceae bacterium]
MPAPYPVFVKRDLDGFFGLFVDNLVQLLLIVQLCGLCGIPAGSELMLSYILPGAAVSILIGNVYYAIQAHFVARATNRSDVTALPFGINTPSLLIYIYFVMLPVYERTKSAETAWQAGMVACLGSGLIEFFGAFIAEPIRRRTPRAALLSTLAGIAIGFIAMKFTLEIFQRPLVAMLPLAIILITYFSRVGFPLGLPGGFVAILFGTLCAWVLPHILPETLAGPAMSASAVTSAWSERGFHLPRFAGRPLWALLTEIGRNPHEWAGYVSVIIPMGLFNVLGSLQNIESAEAAGDRFPTAASLSVNGIATIVASLFGSCFPTTIYIGHPGWKALGARAGYSTLNGLVITLICLTGTVSLIRSVVPIEAGMPIVLWIGVIITAQAFQTTPRDHAPAVALGLFPAIAAWGLTVAQGAFLVGSSAPSAPTLQSALTGQPNLELNGFLLHGLLVMERGYIFTCMILAAIAAFLIDRKFYSAAIWSLIAAAFAALGLTHAYQLKGNVVDFLFVFAQPAQGTLSAHTFGIAVGYLLFAAVFAAFGWWVARRPPVQDPGQRAAEHENALRPGEPPA